MQYTPVLSAASIILGLYILIIFIFNTSLPASQDQFHLGCYLVEHNLSHSSMIQSTVHSISLKADKLPYVLNRVSPDLIDSKLVNLAKSFQSYIVEYNRQKQQMNHYVQLSKAVGRAYENYKTCSHSLPMVPDFAQNKCANTWLQHQNCSKKLDLLKQELLFLFQEKEERRQKIADILEEGKNGKVQTKNEPDKLEKQFKRKDRELELQQKNIEATIKIIGEKIISTKYNFIVAQNQTTHSRLLYSECIQHRKQFRLCEEISKQVTNLGHGTLESLSQKVEKKRISLMKIQTMLNEEQNKLDKHQLYLIQNRSMDQYRKLHKMFIETKAKMDKNCGCTEAEEMKLYRILQQHLKQQENLKTDLKILQEKEIIQYAALASIGEKRRNLIHQLENHDKSKQKNIEKEQQMMKTRQLRQLEQELVYISKKSLSYEQKFKQLQMHCKSYKDQMSSYLGRIQKISDCLVKKDYYLSLDSSLQQEKTKLTLKLSGRQQLVEQLENLII